MRLIVGDRDWLYSEDGVPITQRMSTMLTALGIENEYRLISGVGHAITHAFGDGAVPYPSDFWIGAFGRGSE